MRKKLVLKKNATGAGTKNPPEKKSITVLNRPPVLKIF
jgi:hypothetical protein